MEKIPWTCLGLEDDGPLYIFFSFLTHTSRSRAEVGSVVPCRCFYFRPHHLCGKDKHSIRTPRIPRWYELGGKLEKNHAGSCCRELEDRDEFRSVDFHLSLTGCQSSQTSTRGSGLRPAPSYWFTTVAGHLHIILSLTLHTLPSDVGPASVDSILRTCLVVFGRLELSAGGTSNVDETRTVVVFPFPGQTRSLCAATPSFAS